MSGQATRGSLASFFSGVAVKRLSTVESNPDKSNQHELNGVHDLRKLFGETRQADLPAKFIFLGPAEDDSTSAEGTVTWYDARKQHPTRSEFRLYFVSNPAMEKAAAGDLVFIGRRSDDSLLLVITKQGSTAENQILWLFGLAAPDKGIALAIPSDEPIDRDGYGFVSRMILEQIGIEQEPDPQENWLEMMLKRFGEQFPSTREFSDFARESLKEVNARDQPDLALMHWMNREELLFRTLEKQIISTRLEAGFGTDVDAFIEFSLTVQNRRKSRAGHALENHLAHAFQQNEVSFDRNKTTERNSKPDFVFPGITQYHDPNFNPGRLSMLGVKSTCKDRWRQVLAEADRVSAKHLLTLEPGISSNQTGEMPAHNLQLVVPAPLHSSYTEEQRRWLMGLRGFIDLVRNNQVKPVKSGNLRTTLDS